jgi:lipoprotein signal peptidase
VFNVADIAINVGAALLVLTLFIESRRRDESAQ